jgi:hypothetical protein
MAARQPSAIDPTFLACPRCDEPLTTMLSDLLARPGLPVPSRTELIARCERCAEESTEGRPTTSGGHRRALR